MIGKSRYLPRGLRAIYGISDMVAFTIGIVCDTAIGVYAQSCPGVPLTGFAGI